MQKTGIYLIFCDVFFFFFAEKTVIIAIENAIIVKKNEIVENVTVENVIVWEKKIKM